jgi:hypothetical protein
MNGIAQRFAERLITMPRHIDADKLFEFIQKEKAWKQSTKKYPRYDQGKYDAFYETLEIIKNQPTAAVEPVVHCGECKYADHGALHKINFICHRFKTGEFTHVVKPDNFCSYGIIAEPPCHS